jgi:hypothetical protein
LFKGANFKTGETLKEGESVSKAAQHWHYDTQHNNIQHNGIQHNDIQHNGIQHNDIQYNDIQYNAIQHNDIQHTDIQYNNIQHNDIQHNYIQLRTLSTSNRLGGNCSCTNTPAYYEHFKITDIKSL